MICSHLILLKQRKGKKNNTLKSAPPEDSRSNLFKKSIYHKEISEEIIYYSNLTPQEQLNKIRYEIKFKFSKGELESSLKLKKQQRSINVDKLKFFHLSAKSPIEQITTKLFKNIPLDNNDYMLSIKSNNEKQFQKLLIEDNIFQ